MRRVEEEFQRKRAREKANIRQQLRLVSSGASSLPHTSYTKARDDPDGSCRESPAPDRSRDGRQRHSNTSSEISGRSKSTTPESRAEERRVYRDWTGAPAPPPAPANIAHPPACARMPKTTTVYTGSRAVPVPQSCVSVTDVVSFTGSPRSDNYRLEFARGRSPLANTPRAPRLLPATRSPSTSGSDLSLRQPIKIRW